MSTDKLESTTLQQTEPMTINQALVGLALDRTDRGLVRYWNFFTQQVPTSASYFMHVLPAVDDIRQMVKEEFGALILNETLTKRMEEEVEEGFMQRDQMYVEYDVREGNALQEMLNSAESLNIDLLVVGQSKGRIKPNILARNLVRQTNANALVIPTDAKADISNILVPIDFSPNAMRSLRSAISLQAQLEAPAKITCLYVYTVPDLNHFKWDGPWIQLKSTVTNNIQDGFNAFVSTHFPEQKDQLEIAMVERTDGSVAKSIINYAAENNCDFMCLGAKGHSKVHLLLLGSVTEGVLSMNNDLPVLIVK